MRWWDHQVLPEAEELTREEKEALKLLKENLREQLLLYTAPHATARKGTAGAKRPRPEVRL